MRTFPYCLNIHPGETLADVYDAIGSHTLAVKARVSPDAAYPVGLRLAATAAEELAGRDALDAFKAFLSERDLFVTGINGFPYGTFHRTTVKTAVYEPDWSTPERLKYTGRLATALARLLPEGETGSVSTVPLSYKTAVDSETSRTVFVRSLAVMAECLQLLHQEHGREIVLALEPEPDCLLEDTDGLLGWFENEFLYEGTLWLSRSRRRTKDEAETLLRTYIGLCFDTCHFAVGFEDPLTALRRCENAGLRVARVQLSAAVRTVVSDASLERLAAFIDPVYLHQTKISLPLGRILSLPDLTAETLKTAALHTGRELRTHFHIPLFYAGDGILESTRTDLTPAFFAHVQNRRYPMEIETYTFDVLPPELHAGTVVESLVREHDWVIAQLPPAAGQPASR